MKFIKCQTQMLLGFATEPNLFLLGLIALPNLNVIGYGCVPDLTADCESGCQTRLSIFWKRFGSTFQARLNNSEAYCQKDTTTFNIKNRKNNAVSSIFY